VKKILSAHQSIFFKIFFTIFLPAFISCTKANMNTITSVDNSKADTAKTFLALGDSYTIGQSVSSVDRFPSQTELILRGQNITIKDPQIIATTGWTTKNLIDALNTANLPTNFDVITLLIGVNNQYQGRSLDEYKTEFAWLVDRAIQYANKLPSHVFVLSIPDYSLTPFAQESDTAKIAREINQFNVENKKISLQLGVNYVDITPISREQDPELLAGDGLHPSGKQYKRWADLLAPMIKKVIVQ
jgi:lysophospholipase L1-like esterase